jgi:hypothetical protein
MDNKMHKKFIAAITIGTFLFSLISPVFVLADSTTVTIQPSSADARVEEKNPRDDENFGSGNELKIKSKVNDNKRTFIRFDLSSLPNGINVTQAILQLYLNDAPDADVSRTYNLYRVTNNWGELSITWNNQPTATSTVTSSTTSGIVKDVWLPWDVTTDVNYFYNNSSQNFGWMIQDREEDSPNQRESVFHSKEASY